MTNRVQRLPALVTPEHWICPEAPAVLELGDGGVDEALGRLGFLPPDAGLVSTLGPGGFVGVAKGVEGFEGYGFANTGLGKLGTEFGRDGGDPEVKGVNRLGFELGGLRA